MLEKFVKDIRFGGVINNIIYTASNIYMQYYLTTQSTAFEGFKLIHHIDRIKIKDEYIYCLDSNFIYK